MLDMLEYLLPATTRMQVFGWVLPDDIFRAVYPDDWLKKQYGKTGAECVKAVDALSNGGNAEVERVFEEWAFLEREYARRGFRPLSPRELISPSQRAFLGEPLLFGDETRFYATDIGEVVEEVEKMKIGRVSW